MVASLKNGAGSVNAMPGVGEGALGWDAGVNPYCCRGRPALFRPALFGSVSFQVVWLSSPRSGSSASRLCSVHTVPNFSRRRNSRLCRSKRDVVQRPAGTTGRLRSRGFRPVPVFALLGAFPVLRLFY